MAGAWNQASEGTKGLVPCDWRYSRPPWHHRYSVTACVQYYKIHTISSNWSFKFKSRVSPTVVDSSVSFFFCLYLRASCLFSRFCFFFSLATRSLSLAAMTSGDSSMPLDVSVPSVSIFSIYNIQVRCQEEYCMECLHGHTTGRRIHGGGCEELCLEKDMGIYGCNARMMSEYMVSYII